jgi:hypothetical protein
MNKIRFPIGDWSDDGHGKCDYFFATTPLSVQDVREAHFVAPSVIGFDIGCLYAKYREGSLSQEIENKISEILPDTSGLKYDWREEDLSPPESLFFLWISLLNEINPALELTPMVSDYEDINFYGRDEQGRHLSTPGYGLFE